MRIPSFNKKVTHGREKVPWALRQQTLTEQSNPTTGSGVIKYSLQILAPTTSVGVNSGNSIALSSLLI